MGRTLLVPSNLEKVSWASHQLLDFLQKQNWDRDSLFAIRLAVEEALTNAIKHGNRQDLSKKVRFEFDLDKKNRQVTILVEDQGKGFNPLHLSDLLNSKGYGLVLIYHLMDEVRYNRRGNQVKMVKRRSDCDIEK